jgi:hypothetical protein
MKKKYLLLLLMGIVLIVLSASSVNVAFGESNGPMLKMVSIDAKSPGAVKNLARMGIDITAVLKGPLEEGPRGVPMQTYLVEAVVSALDEKKLGRENFSWSDVPGKGPVKKTGESYDVYKSFDAPKTGIKAQLNKIKSTYPKISHLETFGYTNQERPMLAMRLTNEKIKGEKPQVLFVATHHAREWVATEMAMRLIKYLTTNYGSDGRVTNLLDTVEVWVIPVGNPDGYQYTFTTERLWRKNLRDNDGDGEITIADGVDLNRNFESHWGLDNEGSSPIWSNATYRGIAPNSEPETQAVVNFIKQNDFKFIISYHTYGNLILYPWGWQVNTASLDDPIFVAQAGTDANPAIWDSLRDEGYDPGVGADLYIMNGNFTDWTYQGMGIPSHTVEFTKGSDFRFPDDEDMVQTVFEDSLDFALSAVESALDPAHPVSPVGIAVEDVYHTPLTTSYGPNQMIEVLARKGLDLTLCVNSICNSDSFTEKLGSVYNDEPGVYFSRYVAVISGQSAGETVTYEIREGASTLGSYSYSVVSATGNPILVMAAEDYTGNFPTYPPGGPFYLNYYTDALDAGGYPYDVWDVDLQGVPSFPEVISHYDVAIWYTGDDYAPTVPNVFITHLEEALEFRDFINYQDGKLFATGQDIAWLSAVNGQITDDFFQYYLGAYIDMDTGGIDSDTSLPFDVMGEAGDPVFDGLNFSLAGGDGADNQCCSSTFLLTSYFLPHFQGSVAARYERPGGPTDPYSGDYYVYSQMADRAYKRLGGTFTLPLGAPTLRFWVSYDIEFEWDYAFVEITEAGTDNWTTLPDENGLTTQSTGDSCEEGWVEKIHPFLAHYMDVDCNPIGTTGEWHAFTSSSGGWRQVEVDLSAYADKTVELYISYTSDWGGTQRLGVFVDDIELSGYPIEDFEAGMGQWVVSPPPEGSGAFNNWVRTSVAGFPESPAIRTDNSVYLGFGFEAIDTTANRNTVMDRVMKYLGQ